MVSLSLALLSQASLAAAADYKAYPSANAYVGHGAVNIDTDTTAPTGLSKDDCEARCDSDVACDCVTFLASEGQCWKRSACVPEQFSSEDALATFVKSSGYVAYPKTSAYEGHGGKEIDTDSTAPTGLSVEACLKRCDSDSQCKCTTFLPSNGQCWKRGACDPYSFDSEGYSSNYVTYMKKGSGGPTPVPPAPAPKPSMYANLMTKDMLGEFEDETWEGYACSFSEWTSCVNATSVSCDDPLSTCSKCTSKRGGSSEPITCTKVGGQMQFRFPPGGIFPVIEQFTVPANTAIIGAANPSNPQNQTKQQTDIAGQTWFVVPAKNALCGDDPFCQDASAKAPTACSGDPRTHRQGFLMSSNSMLKNINFQGADLGRAASAGTLCGPGAIELPGCRSGEGCSSWNAEEVVGEGLVHNVVIQNVRLSDAVKRADVQQMHGDCNSGEALDSDGNHVRAHQVSFWVSKLPDSEKGAHSNILIENLVSTNSRADGLNVHGATRDIMIRKSYIANSGDDCLGMWSTGIENLTIQDIITANCAITAGPQSNWGSCMGTYAFKSLTVDGMKCYDPQPNNAGCNPRTHWTAIHLNHAFSNDCMPTGASLSLSRIEYFLSETPETPLARAKCGQCRSCCGSCSYEGFDELIVDYLDDSVPTGQCMSVSAGCDSSTMSVV